MTIADVVERRRTLVPTQAPPAWVVSFDAAPVVRDGWTVIGSGASGRTLSLLDVAPSERPMTARTNRAAVVFDGELYDRAELDRRLASGTRAATPMDDADRVARAYEKWGDAMLTEIKGVYSFVLWDDARQVLLGVRDRLGIYPLYYASGGTSLLLSISQAALVRQPNVSRELNRAHLADRLCSRWLAVEETYYAGVSRVPASHALRVTTHGRSVTRYWDPAPLDQPMKWLEGDVVDQFNNAFQVAVTRSTGGRPSGIFLSGGLDSVSIAAVAVEESQARGIPLPRGLSLSFPTHEANEEPVQRGVAATLGMPLDIVPLEDAAGPEGLLGAGMELSRAFEQPLLNFWLPGYDYMSAIGAQHGCETIMTGSGGDEWLGVSPYLAADLLHGGQFAELYKLWATQRKSYKLSSAALARSVAWTFGARPLLGGAVVKGLERVAPWVLEANKRRYIRRTTPSWVAPDPALRREIDERAERTIGQQQFGQYYLREIHRGLVHLLPSIEFEETFEAGRRFGVRRRSPYWDADLVEFLFHVSPADLNRGGRSKGLVREAMARRFPQLGFDKQKKVLARKYFESVVSEQWDRNWQRLGGVPSLARLGVVDPKKLHETATGLIADPVSRDHFMLYDSLNLEVWASARS